MNRNPLAKQNPDARTLREIEDARGTAKPGVWGTAKMKGKSLLFGRVDWSRTTPETLALRLCRTRFENGKVVFLTTNNVALVPRHKLSAFYVFSYEPQEGTHD